MPKVHFLETRVEPHLTTKVPFLKHFLSAEPKLAVLTKIKGIEGTDTAQPAAVGN